MCPQGPNEIPRCLSRSLYAKVQSVLIERAHSMLSLTLSSTSRMMRIWCFFSFSSSLSCLQLHCGGWSCLARSRSLFYARAEMGASDVQVQFTSVYLRINAGKSLCVKYASAHNLSLLYFFLCRQTIVASNAPQPLHSFLGVASIVSCAKYKNEF